MIQPINNSQFISKSDTQSTGNIMYKRSQLTYCLTLSFLTFFQSIVIANEVTINSIELIKNNSNWNINVTLKHKDSGWGHFANAWQIEDLDGNVLASRVLMHPHVDEQPFTRGLVGIRIPENLSTVIVKARDSQHGWSKHIIKIDLKNVVNNYLKVHTHQ